MVCSERGSSPIYAMNLGETLNIIIGQVTLEERSENQVWSYGGL